jgi:hypothetical protein
VTRAASLGAALALGIVLVGGPSPAHAQELQTVLGVAAGTGVSLGRGNPDVVSKISPLFLDVDLGLIFDFDDSFEWTPSIIMELTGRVSLGVDPSVKHHWRFGRFSVYGGIGVPFIFAPFTLLGVEPAVGVTFRIFPRFGLVLELHADVFFAGSDLPDGSVLAKMDGSLGIRIDL